MKNIHETVLKDIIDLKNDLKDFNADELLNKRRSMKSIASGSSNLTLVFPVFCSNSIPIGNASMVTKAIERKCVTMLQMIFAARQITAADNAVDYLKQFHNNLQIGSGGLTVDNVLNVVDTVVANMESTGAIDKIETRVLTEQECISLIKEDMKNINTQVLPFKYNKQSLNEFKVKKVYNGIQVLKEASPFPFGPYSVDDIAKMNKDEREMRDELRKTDKYAYELSKRKEEEELKKLQIQNIKTQTANIKDQQAIARAAEARNREKQLMDKQRHIQGIQKDNLGMLDTKLGITTKAVPKLIDTDIKKANELIPTMMQVTVFSTVEGQAQPIPMTFVIGIKAKLYPVDSADIISRVISKTKDTRFLTKLVRATTREISFLKDFVFGIEQAKIDALSQSKRGSSNKMWKVLERRAKLSKLKRLMSSKNDASAISTLIISQEEVDYIKSMEKINLEDAKVTRNILEAYNLLSFVIVDEVTESCKFLFDTGDDLFETVTFSSLEREASDGQYKKIVNLMNKISR